MSRSVRVLAVAVVLVVPVALAAVVIWQAEVHQVPLPFLLGVTLVVLGTALMALHLGVGDATFRRHLGEPGAAQMRRFCRGGWVGVLLGAALLGVHYLDRWAQATAAEAQYKVALNRGLSAAKDKDWQMAVDALSEAIRLSPDSATAHRNRGMAYGQQGQLDRALADFDEAVRLDPNDARNLYGRGVAYFRKEAYDRALADFGEAIRLNPGYAKAYLARSRVYAKKGDDAKAAADQQKAVELDPSLGKAEGENT